MPAVARGSGKDTVKTGHGCTGTTHTDKCSANVFANNIGVCRKGDKIKVHNHPVGDGCAPHSASIKAGSATVFVNNIPISRKGDKADAGSISSGSDNVFAGDSTSSVTVNEAPIAIASTITMVRSAIKQFTTNDFKFTDINNNGISAVIITKLPKTGTLKLGTAKMKANQSVPADKIPTISYVPNTSKSGVQHASISFKIKDDGGTLKGGKDTSNESTIVITITPK